LPKGREGLWLSGGCRPWLLYAGSQSPAFPGWGGTRKQRAIVPSPQGLSNKAAKAKNEYCNSAVRDHPEHHWTT